LGLLAGAIWDSWRIAYADSCARKSTLAGLTAAIGADEANARYHYWRAQLLDFEGLDPTAELLRAVTLNPRESSAWIQLAAKAEAQERFREAERYLLRAAGEDKLFDPRWGAGQLLFPPCRRAEFLALDPRGVPNELSRSHASVRAVLAHDWRQRRDLEGDPAARKPAK